MKVTIRPIRAEEADALWKMMNALDGETDYMLFEPGERGPGRQKFEASVRGAVEGEDLLLVAQAEKRLVGFLSARRGAARRIRHSAYIVVGIRAAYRHQGIGTSFFQQLDEWAAGNGVTRLELTVVCANEAARRLYEKSGFSVEGIRKKSMRIDGVYTDEYAMAKLL